MDNLKEYLIKKGANLVGYANLSELPGKIRGHYDFGISIAVALNPAVIKTIKNGPNQLYEREYIRVNQLLDILGKRAVDYIQKKGYQAQAISSTISTDLNNLVDLSTLLPHKTVATRAGLGWIGKSALLITKEYGSAIRLTTVLTNMKLVSGDPVDISYCGKCRNCVQVCPGQAIQGENWHKGLKRDQIYDAFKCRDTIKKMIGQPRITHLICGQCIAVCPWTDKYLKLS